MVVLRGLRAERKRPQMPCGSPLSDIVDACASSPEARGDRRRGLGASFLSADGAASSCRPAGRASARLGSLHLLGGGCGLALGGAAGAATRLGRIALLRGCSGLLLRGAAGAATRLGRLALLCGRRGSGLQGGEILGTQAELGQGGGIGLLEGVLAILCRRAVELAEVVELLPADRFVAGCRRRDGLVVATGPSASSSPASPTAAASLRIGVARLDGDRTRSRRLAGGLG